MISTKSNDTSTNAVETTSSSSEKWMLVQILFNGRPLTLGSAKIDMTKVKAKQLDLEEIEVFLVDQPTISKKDK